MTIFEAKYKENNHSKSVKMPMEIDYERTSNYRWERKPVLESRLLDDMENEETWQHVGEGELSFTSERFISGTKSLRLVSKTKVPKDISPDDRENYGRPFGEAVCRRNFCGEDWSGFNRISFWVYPTLPGFRVISMYARLHNEGTVRIPDSYDREGLHYFLLKPGQWNNVVWEIASLPRERVTAVDIIYRLQGNEPEAADTVCFDIDRLELQKVKADHYEGWNVAPGRISFSHTGYQTGSMKTAISSDIKADSFSVINADTKETVLSKPIEMVKSHIGEFQIMDFSELREEGNYFIKAGEVETLPFRIEKYVWRGTVWKTINFFFCERCGFEVPGIHGNCHRDWQSEHEGKRIIINGGWHDAGDLSQGVCNTAEATYAMFLLAEKVKNDDVELYERLLEEAKWGLDWILKTRFGDGYRSVWATMDFWTDGIIGTFDDITFKALNSPFDNFVTSAAEAVAARVLKDIDPILSSYCLKAAREDWEAAVVKAKNPDMVGAIKRNFPSVQIQAEGALASIELYRMTGEQKYADKAFEQARMVMDCQQKEQTDWDIPLSGFFYNSPEKKTILHYPHRSHIQAPIVAVSELCKEFPGHPEWIEWYSTIVLYSEYMKTIIGFTKPYGMTPCSVYKIDESNEPDYREQILNGIKLSDEYYLRLFPVWFAFRGNNSIILSNAKAMSSSAVIRRDLELVELSQLQLEWMVGRNPFAQSLMYGEGYDYAPQYTAMSGDLVGSLPVGIQTSENKDIPYWPVNNCYNYKEVWVQPSARWLWLMADLVGSAKIHGITYPGDGSEIEFIDNSTGSTIKTKANAINNGFYLEMPEGKYIVRNKGKEKAIVLLPGEVYELDLSRFYNFSIENENLDNCKIKFKLKIESNCYVHLEFRTKNIVLDSNGIDIEPSEEARVVELSGRIAKNNEKWIVAVIPNYNHSELVEIHG